MSFSLKRLKNFCMDRQRFSLFCFNNLEILLLLSELAKLEVHFDFSGTEQWTVEKKIFQLRIQSKLSRKFYQKMLRCDTGCGVSSGKKSATEAMERRKRLDKRRAWLPNTRYTAKRPIAAEAIWTHVFNSDWNRRYTNWIHSYIRLQQ